MKSLSRRIETDGRPYGASAPSPAPTPAPTPAPGPVPAQRRKGQAKPAPVPAEAFAHLTLGALRDYRAALHEQEGKVSYWRRILQGRLDVVASGSEPRKGGHERLGEVLTGERVGAGRRVLAQVGPVDDIPPLPHLAELWERRVDSADPDGLAELVADLQAAEQALSSYRAALHARISGATDELIARYRAEPSLCLAVLPSRSGRPTG